MKILKAIALIASVSLFTQASVKDLKNHKKNSGNNKTDRNSNTKLHRFAQNCRYLSSKRLREALEERNINPFIENNDDETAKNIASSLIGFYSDNSKDEENCKEVKEVILEHMAQYEAAYLKKLAEKNSKNQKTLKPFNQN